MRTLVWFRGKDLRVADHAPLRQAAAEGELVPLFVIDPYFFAPERARELPHRIQFLVESLEALKANIEHLGSELMVVKGKSIDVVPELSLLWKVDRIFAHRWSEPFARERDRLVSERSAVPFVLFEGETLAPPGSILTGGGTPFSVYTPFSRAFRRESTPSAPLAAPKSLPPLPSDLKKPVHATTIPTLKSLGITKNETLLKGGERAGRDRLKAFLKGPSDHYDERRDRMDMEGTSRLSADLKFGTVSVRTVWHAAHQDKALSPGLDKFTNEILWREFTHHTLFHRPELLREPFRSDFVKFPWQKNGAGWKAWEEGKTGYPIVDASARELLADGYVHNRARMISASFLTKHLLVDYKRGEAHYMKWLTDGDWASNNAGWQWSAGCGCDAQPYFRVFNPITQGERFDPDGDYVRRWVPELSKLGKKHIHSPWTASKEELSAAGVVLGKNYPEPIVDHATARARFLSTAKEYLGGETS